MAKIKIITNTTPAVQGIKKKITHMQQAYYNALHDDLEDQQQYSTKWLR